MSGSHTAKNAYGVAGLDDKQRGSLLVQAKADGRGEKEVQGRKRFGERGSIRIVTAL